MSEWQPIDTAPEATQEMFVVKAFGAEVHGARYTSDPWCVWRDGRGGFSRWPHKFQPTHWMPLPADPKESA